MTLLESNVQPEVRRMLHQAVKQDKVAHAYLFSGPGESLKIQMALDWAKAMICTTIPGEGCSTCYSCKALSEGNHPNWHVIEPDGNFIKIDQIRTMQKEFQTRAKNGGKKFFIIKQAERLRTEAANSFLKWLEEPTSDLLIILLTSSRMNILPTIASRVQEIRFLSATTEDIFQQLKETHSQLTDDTIRAIAAISENDDDAKLLAETEWFAELHGKMIKWAQTLLISPTSAMLMYQELIGKSLDQTNIRIWIRLIMIWYRDLVMSSIAQSDRMIHRNQAQWFAANAGKRPVHYWLKRIDSAQAMLSRLSLNPSIPGLMDAFALEEVSN